jgi:protein PsiE
MKPNKFSKLAQKSLTLTAQIVLIVIAVATVFAIAQEIGHVWEAGSITVGDLLMLFLYLEVISMLNHYLGSGNLPVRYPLYIGIISLAHFLVLDIKEIDAFKMFALSGSILLIAAAILIVRYGHVRFPYTEDN